MSHIAVWTDANERVVRKHHHPDSVDTSGATETEQEPVDPPETAEPWERVHECFNTTDGFYYEVEDPLDGVSLTSQQKMLLEYAKDNKTREEAVELAKEIGGSN